MTAQHSPPDSHAPPGETVLLLSFAKRDSLAGELSRQGFRVVAARRAEGIVRRFRSLDAALVVLDACGAFDQALAAAAILAASVAAKNANILLLYDRADAGRVHAFAECGVTAMLPAPWCDAEMTLAIGLALRQAGAPARPLHPSRQIWWHGNVDSGTITIDSAVEAPISEALLGSTTRLRDAVARLGRADRKRAFAAYRKLRQNGGYTAFSQTPHDSVAGGGFVHHLVMSEGRLAGHAEWLASDNDQDLRQPHDAMGHLATFAATFAHCRRLLRDGAAIPAIALVEVKGLDRYGAEMGFAAANILLHDFTRQLDRMIRQELGHSVRLSRVRDHCLAVIATEAGVAGRLALEVRLMAALLTERLLVKAHHGLSLSVAHGTVRKEDSAAAVLARLTRRLTVPQASVDQLDVRAALAESQIIVRFQPQFDAATDRLIGAEALARWQHRALGELGGGALFAAAGASGMTQAVSAHVWQLTLQAMASWPETMASLRVAMNITAQDMADPALAHSLLQLAQSCGIAPYRLAVEVTESAMIANPDLAAASLDVLRKAGVKVALDDFGTGYSGLAWLKQLPVDYIKIDSGFARDAHGSMRDAAVLRGVIELADGLGMGVLAEGVESAAQRVQLTTMGCKWYQGYLKAPALGNADFIAFVIAAQSVF
ncbi:MAG: EAL domain-containing protein [Sphingopyxis sp.]